jgi:hypothetical protein
MSEVRREKVSEMRGAHALLWRRHGKRSRARGDPCPGGIHRATVATAVVPTDIRGGGYERAMRDLCDATWSVSYWRRRG